MRDSENPDLSWLYSRNAKKTYDASDAGMTWWLLTGGPEGGDENGGWQDYKPYLEALVYEKRTSSASVSSPDMGSRCYFEQDGLVVMEAEATASELGQWGGKLDRMVLRHADVAPARAEEISLPVSEWREDV